MPPPDLTPGLDVDARYRLVQPLGEGAFGTVWRASDLRLSGRAVAIKFLKPAYVDHADVVARFHAEADALAMLQHPNVVGVMDRGSWQGLSYLVTEFVDGISLSQWIAQYREAGRSPLLTDVAALFDQICAGVEAAHAVRSPGAIVHRDLKPDNVLIRTLPGGEPSAKVLDFGISQLGERKGTRTGMLLGTPMYMAPEQAMGQSASISPATDVFALGVLLVEMLTLASQLTEGESWWGTSMQTMDSVRPSLERMRSDVPAAVWTVAARALQARARERFADAGELRRAARAAFGSQGAGATEVFASPVAEPSLSPTVMNRGPAHVQPSPTTTAGIARTVVSGPPVRSTPATRAGTTSPSYVPSRTVVIVGTVFAAAAVVVAIALSRGHSRPDAADAHDTGRPTPRPAPPITSPATTAATTAPAIDPHACTIVARAAFHLRDTEVFASDGRPYPAGARMQVLSTGTLRRSIERMFRVRMPDDGQTGFVFLSATDLAACDEPLRSAAGPRPPENTAPVQPLASDREVSTFVQRWLHDAFEQQGRAPLDGYYTFHPKFRAAGRGVDALAIQRYWTHFFELGGSMTIDGGRSDLQLEQVGMEPSVTSVCDTALPGASGPIVRIRLWATEYSPQRAPDVPCNTLQGVYLLRLRRVEGSYRICYETWSLREGLCASCPQAPACAGFTETAPPP